AATAPTARPTAPPWAAPRAACRTTSSAGSCSRRTVWATLTAAPTRAPTTTPCTRRLTTLSGRLGRGAARARLAVRLAPRHEGGVDLLVHHGRVDDALGDVGAARKVVHDVQEHLLDDRAEAPRPGPAFEGLIGHRVEGVVGEVELDVFELEELLVLLDEGVLGLDQEADERLAVEVRHRAHHGEADDELGDQAELQQGLREDLVEDRAEVLLVRLPDVGTEAHALV